MADDPAVVIIELVLKMRLAVSIPGTKKNLDRPGPIFSSKHRAILLTSACWPRPIWADEYGAASIPFSRASPSTLTWRFYPSSVGGVAFNLAGAADGFIHGASGLAIIVPAHPAGAASNYRQRPAH